MGILDIFRPLRTHSTSRWKELGGYYSVFNAFGTDIYKSDVVRSCVRPLAEFTSKATARCSDKQLERLLNNRPNLYMSGRDFLYKIRTRVELTNTCMIYIARDDRGKVSSLYPVPYAWFEALEYANGMFIRFHFEGEAGESLVLPWDDLAVIRKDYNKSDIAGDPNTALLNTLELLNTTNQGIANAIKATANLRGILKSTKAMLSPEDVKKNKDNFVKDYLSLENEGGIASLDSTQEFTPIKMDPAMASHDQMKEFREDVYRYFGVNDEIVMSNMSPDKIEAFYELRIEPFLVALSNELTSKIYAGRQLAYDNWIVYEANKLQFASLEKKIQMYKEVVLYGGMLVDEWREACNMQPLPNGEGQIRIMRLDAGPTSKEGDSDGTESDA